MENLTPHLIGSIIQQCCFLLPKLGGRMWSQHCLILTLASSDKNNNS